jgi:hypothetical protein
VSKPISFGVTAQDGKTIHYGDIVRFDDGTTGRALSLQALPGGRNELHHSAAPGGVPVASVATVLYHEPKPPHPSQVEPFDIYIGDGATARQYAAIITTEPDGSEAATLAFAPVSGNKYLPKYEAREDQKAEAEAVAYFLARAANRFLQTEEGKAEWALVETATAKVRAHYPPVMV